MTNKMRKHFLITNEIKKIKIKFKKFKYEFSGHY